MLLLFFYVFRFFQKNIKYSTLPISTLTLILLTWRIRWAPNNVSRWQMGFNLTFEGLISESPLTKRCEATHYYRCRSKECVELYLLSAIHQWRGTCVGKGNLHFWKSTEDRLQGPWYLIRDDHDRRIRARKQTTDIGK